jgi:hypothetical protein
MSIGLLVIFTPAESTPFLNPRFFDICFFTPSMTLVAKQKGRVFSGLL